MLPRVSVAEGVEENDGGDVVAKAVPLTWRRVEKGHPPLGCCGRASAIDIAADSFKGWLKHPKRSLRPRSEWPGRFRRARAHIKPEQEDRLAEGLFRHGICNFLSDGDLIYDDFGFPLINGLSASSRRMSSPRTLTQPRRFPG